MARAPRHVLGDELFRAGGPGQRLLRRGGFERSAAHGGALRNVEGDRVLLLRGALREVLEGILRHAVVREDLGPGHNLGVGVVGDEQLRALRAAERFLCALGRSDLACHALLHGEDHQHDVLVAGAGLLAEEHRRGVGGDRDLCRPGGPPRWRGQALRALRLPSCRARRGLGEVLPHLAEGGGEQAGGAGEGRWPDACAGAGREVGVHEHGGDGPHAEHRHRHHDLQGGGRLAAGSLLRHARGRAPRLRQHAPRQPEPLRVDDARPPSRVVRGVHLGQEGGSGRRLAVAPRVAVHAEAVLDGPRPRARPVAAGVHHLGAVHAGCRAGPCAPRQALRRRGRRRALRPAAHAAASPAVCGARPLYSIVDRCGPRCDQGWALFEGFALVRPARMQPDRQGPAGMPSLRVAVD
mmetsp:Transcript_8907/g.28317  ORF Transcript_8907/g.28317 Transcript_8907/m.28317 type:complete len:409 (-) Transcript_8907:8-1234(-)